MERQPETNKTRFLAVFDFKEKYRILSQIGVNIQINCCQNNTWICHIND